MKRDKTSKLQSTRLARHHSPLLSSASRTRGGGGIGEIRSPATANSPPVPTPHPYLPPIYVNRDPISLSAFQILIEAPTNWASGADAQPRRRKRAGRLFPKAPARLRDFALCWKKHSLASTGFLEHLKTPSDADGALSTQC